MSNRIEKKRVKTTINGKTYILVGDYSQEHMHAAAKLTQEQFAQIQRMSPSLDNEQLATLLALNTIATQIRLEQELMQLRKRVKKLEFDVLDAKQPERVLKRGMSTAQEVDASIEQTSLEQFNSQFHEHVSTKIQLNDTYVPAIFKKDGQ